MPAPFYAATAMFTLYGAFMSRHYLMLLSPRHARSLAAIAIARQQRANAVTKARYDITPLRCFIAAYAKIRR